MNLLPQNAKKTGEITVLGKKNANEIAELYGKKIGMTFQDPFLSLNPTLKIKSQISIILKKRYGKLSRKEIYIKSYELLKKLGFDNIDIILNSYPSELSGGMNQKINIALSIELEPDIIIFDEITSALDYNNQDEIINLIIEYYKKKNMTIIFVTHNIILAKKISDRIIIMKEGKIVDDSKNENGEFMFKSSYSKILYDNATYMKKNIQNINFEDKLIQLKNITKTFNKKEVLKQTNLILNKGETIGIIGESGCGKTTLCKIICGIYKPDSGYVVMDKNINVEMVFQSAKSSLDFQQTVRSILNENNKINKRKQYDDTFLMKYIKDFNLPFDTLDRFPDEFSGGQNQKIAIIRALLNKPNVIIFDEPTSALDVSSQKDILDIINHIKEKYNLTYIFISHNPQVINFYREN